MLMRLLERSFFRILPERLKRPLYLRNYSRKSGMILEELSRVPIVESGCESLGQDRIPFVILSNNVKLYGQWPTQFEREVYTCWQELITPAVTEDTIRIAIDVILRYLYPHAMPQLTAPYPRRARRCCHLQHIETIEDLPGLSQGCKNKLKEIYSLKPGETFLDIGAYMGYGTIRLKKELGAESRIISVEPDPDALKLLEKNISCNNLSNISLVSKAVWNRSGEILNFSKKDRQANSLISDMIKTHNSVSVETTTVDEILRNTDEGTVDAISITVNGAEVEAVEGMEETIKRCRHIRLSIAGWYKRGGKRICEIISPKLRDYGLELAVGQMGGVLAWK